MTNNFLLSSLLPFIEENEMAYYAKLDDEILVHLISLAPFNIASAQLRQLSSLNADELAKASEILPTMNAEEIEMYFENLDKDL